jgi:VanZ family protein
MEAMQLFFARYPSVSDLIFTTVGGIIGSALATLPRKHKPGSSFSPETAEGQEIVKGT